VDDDVQQAESVALDAAGNIFVAGIFGGKIDFGGLVHQAADGQDVFLAKLAPDGTRLWSKSWDGTSSGNAPNLALDAQGNVLFTGNFGQTLDFGCATVLAGGGDDDVFVAKLSGVDGACIWNEQYGDSGSAQIGRSIAAASNGDAIVLCELSGTVNFGGGNLNGNSRDVVVARLAAADGAHVWSVRATDPLDQFPSTVAVDPTSDAVFVFGSFLGSLTLDARSPETKLMTAGQEDIFLARLDPSDGHLVWNERFGDFASDFGRALALDDKGALVVTGRYRGAVGFGETTLESVASQGDVFLAKLDPAAPK
jgi:outer membrane protein assembly factor BamB